MNYLLDTNVVSEWVRPRPDLRVIRWLEDVDEDRVFLSVVTLAELQQGIELLPDGEKRTRLSAWLANELLDRFEARLLDITADIAREWGRVRAARQRSGRPLGPVDAFFAATSRVRKLTLATRNDRDFADSGIELFNPWLDRYDTRQEEER